MKSVAVWAVDCSVQRLINMAATIQADFPLPLRVYVSITADRAALRPELVPDLFYAFREAKLNPWAVPVATTGQPSMSPAVFEAVRDELSAKTTDILYLTLCSHNEMTAHSAASLKRSQLPDWLNVACLGPDSQSHFHTVNYDSQQLR